jgi:aspartate/methionine/tyrosine aminotransferase
MLDEILSGADGLSWRKPEGTFYAFVKYAADLPAGKHVFIVWQEKAGYLNRTYEVELKAGEKKDVKLAFGAAKFAAFDGPRSATIAVNVSP